MKNNGAAVKAAIFFCQRIDPDQDRNRRLLEKEFGPQIKFFPLPCSGRIEVLHLLKALETGAGKVYVITCPEGACRYGQGNARAKKRVGYAKALVQEIGLSPECIELVIAPEADTLSIDGFTRQLLGLDIPAAGNGPARAVKRSGTAVVGQP